MSALSDRDLIAKALGGEVGAFATLVSRYRDVYTRFAVRMLAGYDPADEAIQAAFVRAFQSLNRCKEPDQLSDWLYRLVVAECRARALRRGVRERRVTGEMPAVGAPARPLAGDAEAMQRVIDQIDPVLREPFVLLYIEEQPYARIAALTGVPVQTLERQVDRACARLREIMPTASQDTRLSSVGLELLSSEPAPSLAVQVATPLRRPEVLNNSFEDRLMAKLMRSAATPASGVTGETASPANASNGSSGAPLPPSPWTMHNEPPVTGSRRVYLAVAGVGACLALAAFITGYAARRWRDVRDVERRRPGKPVVVNKIVRRTDTVRVVRSDTIVLARFAFVDDAAKSVSLVGDFNDWSATATPLLAGASKGSWSATISLPLGRHEYAFLVDGKRWVLDRFTRATHEEAGVETSTLSFGAGELGIPGDEVAARTRIKKVLPRAIADPLLARITTAKEQGLPPGVLEQSTLKLSAKRVPPKQIERTVLAEADRLTRSRQLLATAAHSGPTPGEVDAGAEALRVADSATVLELARVVPSHRSTAIPLMVLAQLVEGGMNAEEGVDKIRTRLHNDATDAALERWADETVVRLASVEKARSGKTAKHGPSVVQAGSPKNGATKSTEKAKKAAGTTHKP